MISQLKAVPFYKTRGCDEFKIFVTATFNYHHIYDVNYRWFDGWKGKDMGNYFKCSDSCGNEIEFYANKYLIKTKYNANSLPLPTTLDCFLLDMERVGVDLYWNDEIVEKYSPRNMLSKESIHKYYFDLLTRMGKSFEISPLEK